MKDGLRSSCKFCTNHYHYSNEEKNLRERNRRAFDVIFKLAHNIKHGTCQAFKSRKF